MKEFFSLYKIRATLLSTLLFLIGGIPFGHGRALIADSQLKPTPKSTVSPSTFPTHPEPKPTSSISNTPLATPSSLPTVAPTPTVSASLPTQTVSSTEVARSILVKVGAPDFIGSGTIVGFEKGFYIVVTNAHVLRSARTPYTITTPDRVVHPAKVVSYRQTKGYDLAFLRFKSPAKKYVVAKIPKNSSLQVGDRLSVSGFTQQAPQRETDGFFLQSGAVSVLLKQRMDSGYSIGYTSTTYRGMSGGPVIDGFGRLVGINGLLNDPVWKTRTKFSDGSIACEPLQNLIDKSSFAVAIEDIVKLTSQAKWWKIESLIAIAPKVETFIETQERSSLQKAADKALACQ
jgi:S1-C subfamily serine protease